VPTAVRRASDHRSQEQSLESPGVSVVIVNYNTRDRVLRLLRALAPGAGAVYSEGKGKLELIVVDNASRDGSSAAIREEFPQVKLVAQSSNRGFAGGVNPGVAVATQPLVLLLNSDAQTTLDSISAAASYMASHVEVGILGPRILCVDESPQSSMWRDPSLKWLLLSALGLNKVKALNFERYHERVVENPVDVDCVCGAAFMVRRSLFEELGGLDEDFFMYFEETDFCVRARQRGFRVHHAPVGRFVHEDGGTSRSVRRRTYLDYRRSEILFYKKHGGAVRALAARGLLVLESAVRVPPLLALSAFGGERRASAAARLRLRVAGLRWLLDPRGGLVPDVDRAD
jgi:hypothetical protein